MSAKAELGRYYEGDLWEGPPTKFGPSPKFAEIRRKTPQSASVHSDTPPLDAHSLSVQSLDPHSVPCHTEELPAYDRVTYGVYIYLNVSCNNRVVAQSNSKA